MRLPGVDFRKVAAISFSILFSLLAVGVSVAFASLTFNGTSISGDSNSTIDATGTVTIGATSATGVQIGRAGITVTFPGSVTISGSTTTLQNLIVSGNCTGCGSGNFVAAGDLSGTSTSQTVVGLQGRSVSSTAPSANQVLTWNGTSWAPANTGSGINSINGLSNATTSIVGGGGITVSTSSPNTITITGAAGSITIDNLATTTFQLVGTANQVTVATSAPNTITLSLPQNIGTTSVPIFGGLLVNGNATTTNLAISSLAGTGGCLSVSATGQVTTSTCSGGSGNVTINGIASSTFAFTAGSGLSVASSANPNLITYSFVNPGFVTAASSVTWTAAITHEATTTFASTTIFSYLASSGSPCLTVSATGAVATTTCGTGGGSVTINGFTTSTFSIAAGSNITISTSSPNVITIAASGGGSPTLNGITSSTFSFAAGGTGLTVASSANPNTITYTWTNPGYPLTSGNNTWTGAQTFTATTTFLGPIVESSTGAGSIELTEGTCPSGSSGTDVLCANSSTHALQASLNGGSFVSLAQLAGDLGGTAASPVVAGLQGNPVSSTAPSTNQVLQWNGSAWAPASISGGGGGGSVTTSGPITANTFPFWATTSGGLSGSSTLSISGNTVTNSGNANLGGNLNVTGTAAFNATATFAGSVVGDGSGAGIIGLAEGTCSGASGTYDVLCANSSTHALQTSLNGGSFVSIPQLAGDIGNTAASPKVIGLQGFAVSSTAPSSNQCLVYNGTAWAPGSCGSGSLTGGQNNFIPLWTGASTLGTSTLQATANALVTTGGFAIGTTTNESAGNLFVTGNATTTNLAISSLAGTGGCLSVSATGQVTTSTCSGGGGDSSTDVTINGFTTSTFSIAAGSNVTISTSSPNVITIGAAGGGGSLSGGQTNYVPLWTSSSTLGTSTLSASGNTVTNSGNANLGGNLNVTGTASFAATTTILGNVAIGTSTLTSGANVFASYGTTGTTTLMLGATSTPRTRCLELGGDGGSVVYYLTISSAGTLQISSSTCL